jgi:transglutaminase-like putative cysteine protease
MNKNIGKFIRVMILATWAILFGQLLNRDYFVKTLDIRETQAIQRGREESFLGIYFKQERIGYVKNRMVGKDNGGSVLYQDAVLHLNILETTYPVNMHLQAELTNGSLLENFRFSLSSPFYELNANGAVHDNEVHFTMNTGKDEVSNMIQLNEPPFISTNMRSYLLQNDLEVGEKFKIPYFDPVTMSGRESIIEYKGLKKELIYEQGRIYKLHHFVEIISGIRINIYLDEKGKVIKETSPAGFVFISEPEFRATDIVYKGTEVLSSVSVPAIGKLPDISELSSIRYRLKIPEDTTFDLDQDRQTYQDNILVINKENVPSESLAACSGNDNELRSTAYIQSDNPFIMQQAESIVKSVTNDLEKVMALAQWVYTNLEKKPVLSIPDALSTLRSKVGDCNEHAALFAALSRSLSIPTRVVAGVTYHGGMFYYHAWNEVCLDGEWISLDTTKNQLPADLTHIKFVQGETNEQIKIGALLGRLKIEVLGENS